MSTTTSNTFTKYFAIFAILVSVFFTLPTHDAQAQSNLAEKNKITEILCNAVKLISGGIGKTIAVLIIISLAIALFLGKVSWGMAIAVAVGMGILFGANDLVVFISGGADPCV